MKMQVRGGGAFTSFSTARKRVQRIFRQAVECRPVCEPLERRQLLSAGDPDTSFGVGGAALVPLQGNLTVAPLAVKVDSQGRTVVAGYGLTQSVNFVFVARYTPAGVLDSTFGNGGIVKVAAGAQDQADALAIDSSDRIIVVGDTTATLDVTYKTADMLVARLNVDGSLDTSFNGTGEAIIDFNGGADAGYSAVVQPDGKIVVGGTSANGSGGTYQWALARFNSNGTLDTSFGTADTGLVTTPAGSSGAIENVELDSSQNIVVAGYSTFNHANTAIARYNSNGTLDTSFGGTGMVITAVTNSSNYAYAVDFTSAGQLVVGGYGVTYNASNGSQPTGYDALAMRFNSDGSLDNSFGSGGFETIDFNAKNQFAGAVHALSNGDIMLAGYDVSTAGNDQSMLLRLLPNGALDTSYNSTGRAVIQLGVFAPSAAFGADGSVTMVGRPGNSGIPLFTVRYTAAGLADTTFGTQGAVTTPVTGTVISTAEAIALQGDGKAVIAGYSVANTPQQFVVARLNVDGSLDTTFGTGGMTSVSFGIQDQAKAIAVQPDGKIVAAGFAEVANGSQTKTEFAVVRLNADGSLDQTFGTGGKETIDLGDLDDYVTAIAITTDGKIVLTGPADHGLYEEGAIVRLNSDGSMDTTFNSTGKQYLAMNENLYTQAIAIDAAGNVVVGGYLQTSLKELLLARYNRSGGLDTTFGAGGVQYLYIGNNASISAIAITPTGQIYATGVASQGSTAEFGTERFTASGQLDGSFNGNGYALYNNSSTTGGATSLAVLSDGGVLVAGGSSSATLVEYGPIGALNSSFGTGGVANNSAGMFKVSSVTGMVLRPNGSIVIAGEGEAAANSGFEVFAAQLLPNLPPATQIINGNVFLDFNGDGVQQNGETGFVNVTVYVDLNNSGVYQVGDPSVVTTSTGTFTFSNLVPGNYVVREVTPTGFYTSSAGGNAVTVTVSSSSTPFVGFGIAVSSTITGEVYNDLIGFGFATNNPGLAGVAVYLDVNNDGVFDAGDVSGVSDSNGIYTLVNCPTGTFTLREVLPAGNVITQPTGVATPGYYTISLGVLLPTSKPFGDFKLRSVAGNFNTSSITGSGVVPAGTPLTISLNTPGGAIITQTAATDSSGNYLVNNLGPGTVTVVPGVPVGYTVTPTSASVASMSGAASILNFTALATGIIGGTVFSDDNGNGVQDSGEANLSGLTVYLDVLTTPGGSPVQTISTLTATSTGIYSFTQVPPGFYAVREQLPGTYARVTVPTAGKYPFSPFNGGTISGENFGDLSLIPSKSLTGTIIGTSGSYNNSGNTIAKAFDGNFTTYFDAPTASGSWAGLDLGTPKIITQVSYASRSGWVSRMNGGTFQGSNTANFSSGVANLFVIGANANVSSTALTNSAVSVSTPYRYVRYIGPANSYCDVSELEFFGISPVAVSVTGTNFNANASTQSLTISFSGALSGDPGIASVNLLNITSTTSTTVPSSSLAETFNASNNTMTITFPGFTGGKLPAGVYQATLIAGDVIDANGQHPASNTSYSFITVPSGKLTLTTGRGTISVQQIAIQSGASLDIANNNILLTGGGSGGYSALLSLIQSGYQNGTWQGTSGIVSSTAAANAQHLTGLGLVLSTGQYYESTATQYGDVLLKYTYYGDANLDGKVEGSDYSLIDYGSVNHLTGWGNGDFNYDGIVNGSDYALIDNAFNQQGATLAASVATTHRIFSMVPLIGGSDFMNGDKRKCPSVASQIFAD